MTKAAQSLPYYPAHADFLQCLADRDQEADVANCYGYLQSLTATTVAGVFGGVFFGRGFRQVAAAPGVHH
jgi:hypothetical protein